MHLKIRHVSQVEPAVEEFFVFFRYAPLLIYAVLVTVAFVDPSWSAEGTGTMGANPGIPEAIWNFVKAYQALFGGALGLSLGYLAKWVFDQFSAEREARRQFAASVTTQISDLAKNYYWSLANYAGVLAGLLESYINSRIHHLMLIWDDRERLKDRLDEIAKECADNSFYHFCHLIHLFDVFQFQGSNTYLLTSHAAGETCKRLYNTFISAIPTDDSEAGIDTLKIIKVMGEKRPMGSSKKPQLVSKIPNALFTAEIAEGDLKKEFESYCNWIKNLIPDVFLAADSLRAYNELLNHELALLYKDWFKKIPPARKPYLAEVAYDEWPHTITEQSFFAIDRAGWESVLLRPLGGTIPPKQPREREEKEPETKDKRPIKAIKETEVEDKPSKTEEGPKPEKGFNPEEVSQTRGMPRPEEDLKLEEIRKPEEDLKPEEVLKLFQLFQKVITLTGQQSKTKSDGAQREAK